MSPSLKTSCADIVDNMPYNGLSQIFGPSTDPQAAVKLPLTLTSGKFIPSLHGIFAPYDSSHSPTRRRQNQQNPQKKAFPPVRSSVDADAFYSRRPLRNDHLHPRPLRHSVMVGNVAGGRAIERCVCEGRKEGEKSCDW